eukprot:4237587-Pyramimonas_sp.AAC.1
MYWRKWAYAEQNKLIEDIHMIVVGKADECIQEEISCHEELSGLSKGGSCGLNKKKVIERLKKRPMRRPVRST